MGSVLAAELRERLPKWRPAGILVIGAGEIAREIARHLAKADLGEMTFVNRTETRAAKLTDHYGGRTRPWAELHEAMAASDVIVAATAARRLILSKPRLDAVMSQRGERPPLIIDAGLPRNVETGWPRRSLISTRSRNARARPWRVDGRTYPSSSASSIKRWLGGSNGMALVPSNT